jgi:RNA polymerase sigma-70 factor (ECF subfamily)
MNSDGRNSARLWATIESASTQVPSGQATLVRSYLHEPSRSRVSASAPDELDQSSPAMSADSTSSIAMPTERGPCCHWTDDQLVAAVIERSGGAYGELFRRHSSSVHAVSRAVLGNRPECEDIVAEVFVGFWLHPESYDSTRRSLAGFLGMKANSRSIDLVRANNARRRREERQVREHRHQTLDVNAGLSATELSGKMRHAVEHLPVLEREAIQLAFFTGMTYTDVALFLDAPEGTVKSRIRSGLKRLSASREIRAERV